LRGIDRRLIQNFDWTLLGLGLALAVVGVVNLVSAAPDDPGELIPPTAWRQLMWLGVGSLALIATLVPDYRRLERFAIPVYCVMLALLVAVLLFAPVINGSQRWLILGPARLQPSEIAKLAMILLMARLLNRMAPTQELGLRDLVVPGLLVAVPCVLVLRQPDLGTTLLIALISGTFVLLARVRLVSLAWIAALGAATASVAWFRYLHDYQKERLLTFLNPERDPLGAAYHAIQSQIAIGSGGVFGRGFLRGPQSQLDFLPEQQTDFVFPVLAEEWGFVGAALVLVLYLALMLRGLLVARASKDAFGAYLAFGVVALFFWAGAVNVGMVLGALPVVGVPLPFLSYGGSSLLVCMVGVGLLLNVSMRRYVF
jgi:rod shape determining protein RodA